MKIYSTVCFYGIKFLLSCMCLFSGITFLVWCISADFSLFLHSWTFFVDIWIFLHHVCCFISKVPVNSEKHDKIVHWVSSLFVQMDKRKDPSSVDIKQVLLEMRKYRMGLIQTADQLRFSYLAVTEGAKFIMGDSSVQVSAIHIVFSFNYSLQWILGFSM